MKTAELVIMPQRKRYVKIAPPELGKAKVCWQVYGQTGTAFKKMYL